MSKILQNLANHLPFKKEGFMMVFNDFLEANFDRTRKFVHFSDTYHSHLGYMMFYFQDCSCYGNR